MLKISCKENCKKTKQIRDSEYCTGFCTIDGLEIRYDCESKISKLDIDKKNFLSCGIWDMGIRDNCKICPLECSENKNPTIQKTKDTMKNVSNILNSLGPLMKDSGIDPSTIYKAQSTLNSNDINTNNYDEIQEAVKLTNYAKDVITSLMTGKEVNISEIKLIKERLEKKYKK